jgi:WhiB family transcriptional regulator, redox-sensing transcriptional regulator
MTRLPATMAAGFGHAVPIHGKTGIDWVDPSSPGPVTGRSAWSWIIRHALCRYVSLDPGQWFPASTEPERARHEAAAAIAICHGCPVRVQCLSVSLRYWDIGKYGVWGGLVPAERATLRNRILARPPREQR